jgi:hypothetical protein
MGMDKDTLLRIKKRLEELSAEWYTAVNWNDKRCRRRRMHDASIAISNYADTLPPEILGLFDIEVERGALNAQFAGDDIGSCIDVLEKKIKEMDN